MTNFSINAQILNAISKHICSKDETRYYLKGVNIEISDGVGFAVATDGIIMIVHRFKADVSDCSFIIPSSLIQSLKIKARAKDAHIAYENNMVTITTDGAVLSAPTIDGAYPDWRRAFSVKYVEMKDQYVNFDPLYLQKVIDFAKFVSASGFVVPNGNEPALIKFSRDDLTGIVTPKRMPAGLKIGDVYSRPFYF